MQNVLEIKLSEEILSMRLDENDPCGCYLHKAILDRLNTDLLDSDTSVHYSDISVHYGNIWIEETRYATSADLRSWQEDAKFRQEEAVLDKYPITVIFDSDKMLAYIKGENIETY